ncbi:MAG: hypothetical protein M0R22_10580 [Dehalococcoidia bacterium]|jgi:hypothetical protein|nr:hypothetical protein [Dehalococcoidia bacterium]
MMKRDTSDESKKPGPAEKRPQRTPAAGGRIFVTAEGIACVYDVISDGWSRAVPPLTWRSLGAAVEHRGTAIVMGGIDGGGGDELGTVEQFDPAADVWSVLPLLGKQRRDLGAAQVDGRVYALGGFDGSRQTETCEAYDPREGAWTDIAPMRVGRDQFGVAVAQGCVYVFGGSDGGSRSGSVLAGSEVFDPAAGKWRETAPMPGACAGAAAVAVDDSRIWLFGGFDEDGVSNDAVHVFDAVSGTWLPVVHSVMPSTRNSVAATVIGSDVFLFGGQVDFGELGTCEVFNVHTLEWRKAAELPSPGIYSGPVVF